MKTVKVRKLCADAFAAYGSVVTTEGRGCAGEEGVYKWYEDLVRVDGASAATINLLTAVEREFVCRKFEEHACATETVLPLTGGVIVACIPPGEPRTDRLEAFFVPTGCGVSFAPGTWHYAPYPVSGDVVCAIIFHRGTEGGDAVFADLPEDVGFCL